MTAKEVTEVLWSAEFANDSLLRGKGLSISERRVKKSLLKPQWVARADFCLPEPRRIRGQNRTVLDGDPSHNYI